MAAVISDCGRYRYRLERDGGEGLPTAVIMVNPSTADAETDDATIRKLRGFAERNGWGKLIVGNLFAYRATDVRQLGKVSDPIGPENDSHLASIFMDAGRVVFAWGPVSKQPKYQRARWRKVFESAVGFGHTPFCIGPPAKCGHPKHPLMLPYSSEISRWDAP